jgi:hypothetical protein
MKVGYANVSSVFLIGTTGLSRPKRMVVIKRKLGRPIVADEGIEEFQAKVEFLSSRFVGDRSYAGKIKVG